MWGIMNLPGDLVRLNAPSGAGCFLTQSKSNFPLSAYWSQCTFWCWVLSDKLITDTVGDAGQSQCTFWCWVLSDPCLWEGRRCATSGGWSATGSASTLRGRPAPPLFNHFSASWRQAPPTSPPVPPATNFRRDQAKRSTFRPVTAGTTCCGGGGTGPWTRCQERFPRRAARPSSR